MSSTDSTGRLAVLDGWRALSILLVLACHLLPLGPSWLGLNAAAGSMGMALFFVLSGFLITRFLWQGAHVGDFLIRRLFRIVPLAWLAILIAMAMTDEPTMTWVRHFTFTSNIPPMDQADLLLHFWSLGMEIQFYLLAALLVACGGSRSLLLLPVLCLSITLGRVALGASADITTPRRIDEILAGATLALVYNGAFGVRARELLSRLSMPLLLMGLVVASLPNPEWPHYLRPYIAAGLVGASLVRHSPTMTPILQSRPMAYIAEISFALYVLHPLLAHTWLGMADDKLIKYLKRIPLFVVLFVLSHLSTRIFEASFIQWGHRLSQRLGWRRDPKARAVPVRWPDTSTGQTRPGPEGLGS